MNTYAKKVKIAKYRKVEQVLNKLVPAHTSH